MKYNNRQIKYILELNKRKYINEQLEKLKKELFTESIARSANKTYDSNTHDIGAIKISKAKEHYAVFIYEKNKDEQLQSVINYTSVDEEGNSTERTFKIPKFFHINKNILANETFSERNRDGTVAKYIKNPMIRITSPVVERNIIARIKEQLDSIGSGEGLNAQKRDAIKFLVSALHKKLNNDQITTEVLTKIANDNRPKFIKHIENLIVSEEKKKEAAPPQHKVNIGRHIQALEKNLKIFKSRKAIVKELTQSDIDKYIKAVSLPYLHKNLIQITRKATQEEVKGTKTIALYDEKQINYQVLNPIKEAFKTIAKDLQIFLNQSLNYIEQCNDFILDQNSIKSSNFKRLKEVFIQYMVEFNYDNRFFKKIIDAVERAGIENTLLMTILNAVIRSYKIDRSFTRFTYIKKSRLVLENKIILEGDVWHEHCSDIIRAFKAFINLEWQGNYGDEREKIEKYFEVYKKSYEQIELYNDYKKLFNRFCRMKLNGWMTDALDVARDASDTDETVVVPTSSDLIDSSVIKDFTNCFAVDDYFFTKEGKELYNVLSKDNTNHKRLFSALCRNIRQQQQQVQIQQGNQQKSVEYDFSSIDNLINQIGENDIFKDSIRLLSIYLTFLKPDTYIKLDTIKKYSNRFIDAVETLINNIDASEPVVDISSVVPKSKENDTKKLVKDFLTKIYNKDYKEDFFKISRFLVNSFDEKHISIKTYDELLDAYVDNSVTLQTSGYDIIQKNRNILLKLIKESSDDKSQEDGDSIIDSEDLSTEIDNADDIVEKLFEENVESGSESIEEETPEEVQAEIAKADGDTDSINYIDADDSALMEDEQIKVKGTYNELRRKKATIQTKDGVDEITFYRAIDQETISSIASDPDFKRYGLVQYIGTIYFPPTGGDRSRNYYSTVYETNYDKFFANSRKIDVKQITDNYKRLGLSQNAISSIINVRSSGYTDKDSRILSLPFLSEHASSIIYQIFSSIVGEEADDNIKLIVSCIKDETKKYQFKSLVAEINNYKEQNFYVFNQKLYDEENTDRYRDLNQKIMNDETLSDEQKRLRIEKLKVSYDVNKEQFSNTINKHNIQDLVINFCQRFVNIIIMGNDIELNFEDQGNNLNFEEQESEYSKTTETNFIINSRQLFERIDLLINQDIHELNIIKEGRDAQQNNGDLDTINIAALSKEYDRRLNAYNELKKEVDKNSYYNINATFNDEILGNYSENFTSKTNLSEQTILQKIALIIAQDVKTKIESGDTSLLDISNNQNCPDEYSELIKRCFRLKDLITNLNRTNYYKFVEKYRAEFDLWELFSETSRQEKSVLKIDSMIDYFKRSLERALYIQVPGKEPGKELPSAKKYSRYGIYNVIISTISARRRFNTNILNIVAEKVDEVVFNESSIQEFCDANNIENTGKFDSPKSNAISGLYESNTLIDYFNSLCYNIFVSKVNRHLSDDEKLVGNISDNDSYAKIKELIAFIDHIEANQAFIDLISESVYNAFITAVQNVIEYFNPASRIIKSDRIIKFSNKLVISQNYDLSFITNAIVNPAIFKRIQDKYASYNYLLDRLTDIETKTSLNSYSNFADWFITNRDIFNNLDGYEDVKRMFTKGVRYAEAYAYFNTAINNPEYIVKFINDIKTQIQNNRPRVDASFSSKEEQIEIHKKSEWCYSIIEFYKLLQDKLQMQQRFIDRALDSKRSNEELLSQSPNVISDNINKLKSNIINMRQAIEYIDNGKLSSSIEGASFTIDKSQLPDDRAARSIAVLRSFNDKYNTDSNKILSFNDLKTKAHKMENDMLPKLQGNLASVSRAFNLLRDKLTADSAERTKKEPTRLNPLQRWENPEPDGGWKPAGWDFMSREDKAKAIDDWRKERQEAEQRKDKIDKKKQTALSSLGFDEDD